MLNNIKTVQKERGFTIVELLIVIVVIGILAAITIVAYNGITNRANKTNAEAAAANVLKKAEAYNADGPNGAYPTTWGALTGAATTTTYNLTGVTFTTTQSTTTAPTGPSQLQFFSCSGSTGIQVQYWDYTSTAANKWVSRTTGTCTTPTYSAS